MKTWEREGKWQLCQKLFFPQLGLDESMPSSKISKKLLERTFSEFIAILPQSYKKDMHLRPQYWSLHIKASKKRNIELPISYKKIYKMESEKDVNELANIFKVDLG